MKKISILTIVALSAGLFGYQYYATSKPAPAADVGAPVHVDATMKLADSLVVRDVPAPAPAAPLAEAPPEVIPTPLADRTGGFVAPTSEVKVPANAKVKRAAPPTPKKSSSNRTKAANVGAKNKSPFKKRTSPLTSALNQKFHNKSMFPFSGVVRKDVKPGRQVTKRVKKG